MAFQDIFDYASNLTINRRKMVGVQYSRSQIPLTDLYVTKNPWRFTLEYPGRPWNQMRSLIEELDYMDRYQYENVTIGNNSSFSWLYRYLGDRSTIPTTLLVNSFTGNQLSITNITGLTSGQYLFRRGDMIQIVGKPFPFTVVNDAQYLGGNVTVTTHRPNIITTSVAGLGINVGPNCQIQVFCPNLPTYTLNPGARQFNGNILTNNAIVSWDDKFQFYEFLGNA